MKRRVLISAMAFLAMACVLFGQAPPLSARDMDFPPGAGSELPPDPDAALKMLDESTQEIMDEKGRAVFQDVMDKDELGEDMEGRISNVRADALKQTAYTLALQQAVRWRYNRIMEALSEQESRLNEIFDFSPLLMQDGKVLPPAITEAGPGYRVESKTQASSVDVVYEIVRPAEMISNAPSWRDYLYRSYASFERGDINVGVLPDNQREREMWQRAAVEGWEIGVRQAQNLYRQNLSKLRRDYQGIIKFRTLAKQGMVSVPIIAEGQPGIEVQGERLSVDRRVFRITQPSFFQKEDRWKPKIGIE